MKKVFVIALLAFASIANGQVRPDGIRDISERQFIENGGSTDKAVKMFLSLESKYQSDSVYYQVVVASESMDMSIAQRMAASKANVKILKITQKTEARIGYKEKIEEHVFQKDGRYIYLAAYKVRKNDVN